MAGFARAIAVDLDGTIADGQRVSEIAMAAIDDAREDGLVAVMVTGRILAELEGDFPGLVERFDAVVAENGAVLALGDDIRDLAPPVDEAISRALTVRGVAFRRGRVLLACDAIHAAAVVEADVELGLDCQVVRNRAALMVLPAGVSKGSGLLAALAELGVSAHNTLAIGDAENDLALLEAAELGVAVGNAVPSLRQHADLVLDEPNGSGVVTLLSGPIRSGEQIVHAARRRLTIGRFADGTPTTVPGSQTNLLICGKSGAGKSYLAGLLVEGWVSAGYSVLVIDMEGDHIALDRLRSTIVLDTQPSASELLSVLRQQSVSVVLDVSALDAARQFDYLRSLPTMIEVERAAWGLPHWIVVDEAHTTLGEHGIAADVFRPADLGYCLVTYHPERLCAHALAAIDITITVTAPRVPGAGATAAPNATIRERGAPERSFTVGARRTPHVRHRRKYAVTPLPRHRWFEFRDPHGAILAHAQDLAAFDRLLRSAEPAVVAHHLSGGDFSRWIVGSFQDRELAATVGAIERDLLIRRAADIEHARERLLQEIHARYADDIASEGPQGDRL
jgi:hydroxymethylpyrimidine pyrophosphatase-like HAD family hydrolase